MTKHFIELGAISSRISDEDFDPRDVKEKELFIKFMFHLADISNPTKPWDLCRLWCDLLFFEFFAQGDLEKSYQFPVSQFFDRTTTNIAKSQIGFIDFIIKPAYAPVFKVFPNLAHLDLACDKNKAEWTNMFEHYEEELASGNHQQKIVEKYLANNQA
jgi:cAMP-specific phosphodiesterase 4